MRSKRIILERPLLGEIVSVLILYGSHQPGINLRPTEEKCLAGPVVGNAIRVQPIHNRGLLGIARDVAKQIRQRHPFIIRAESAVQDWLRLHRQPGIQQFQFLDNGAQDFREDFDQYPVLFTGLERALCPRVHFKILVFDCKLAYIGSANLTGVGIGMKGAGNRNFEAGILTDDPELVEAAMNQFDSVWAGFKCKTCRRKQYCGDPILK